MCDSDIRGEGLITAGGTFGPRKPFEIESSCLILVARVKEDQWCTTINYEAYSDSDLTYMQQATLKIWCKNQGLDYDRFLEKNLLGIES
jgi:hypothetical protein